MYILILRITETDERTVWNEYNFVVPRHNIISYLHKGRSHTGRPNYERGISAFNVTLLI